jgi:glycosyltransferase involved in cell wall biosynthesis
MPGNRNIAIIAGTLGQGGAERQLVYILKALLQLEFRPRVFCLTRGEFYESAIRDLGVEVTNITAGGRVSRMKSIAARVHAFSPFAVMSMHFFTNLYAHAAAIYCHVPSIGSLRSDCYSEVQDAGKLGKLSLKIPHVVAANSMLAINNAITLGRAKDSLFLLPNIVDTGLYSPGSKEPAPRPLRIVMAGRLEKAKRTDRFIRLVNRLSKEMDVCAAIYGMGTLETELRQQAEDLNIPATTLSFEGLADDMLDVYRGADVLVSTSDYEGTPNVVLEAQACGLAVIANPVGGVPDIIDDGRTGILVDATNEDALFASTLALLKDENKRRTIGVGAREYVLREYSIGKLTENLAALLSLPGIGKQVLISKES